MIKLQKMVEDDPIRVAADAEAEPQFKKGNRVVYTNHKNEKRIGTVTRDSGPNKTLVLLDGDAISTYLDNDRLERYVH